MGEPTPGPDTPDHDSDTAAGARRTDGVAASSNGTGPEKPEQSQKPEKPAQSENANGRDRARANGQANGQGDGRTNGRSGRAGATRGGAEPEAVAEGRARANGHAHEPDDIGPGDATGRGTDEPGANGSSANNGARPGERGTAAPGAAPDTAGAGRSRRPPTVTRDTARPEGGGRAAPGDASAPARQWPLLTVIGLTALGLLIVGTDPFPQAFRVGTILVGVALLTGAALRRWLPSVGMLAVRSRFTDMVTYGLLGTVIVLLALMTQPRPWLKIPFLEEVVRFTVR
ncbi:DUF3017 domain-containing protein [Streptomyces sp. NPDC002133]|uniref:DUF3017 domain-containing protein n=1 Tax=Streptomyces sp. NPDC002133 TaxID=3154409 RepID=UPI00332B9746